MSTMYDSSSATGADSTPDAWGASNVATVGAAPTDAQYMTQLQAAYKPAFTAAQQGLNANATANGTMYSGAGDYNEQQLQAQDAATLAQGELPLIQQSDSENFQGKSQNTSAINNFLSLLQGQNFSAQQGNQAADNTANAENAAAYNNTLGTNTSNENRYLGEQSGYANSNYAQQLADMYGLISGEQSGVSNVYNSGANNAVSGYQAGNNQSQQEQQGF
jgi:hypothetical protein